MEDLDNEHRNTVEKIFNHPSSGNSEWRQVRSLLEAAGTATDERNGKVKVTLRNRGVPAAARQGRRPAADAYPCRHRRHRSIGERRQRLERRQ